jgi:serine/threonine protein kinase
MGLVYLADDPKKDRQIALKVLARENAGNPTLLKRFRSEALATRELKHPNIVGVYEAGSIDGQFYIALEFVDGTDVAQLIESRGRLPVRRALDITRQVALALSFAHQRNIVHRDIKPSNLLIRRDGAVKLTDMGLARSLDETGEAGITRAGTTVGTVDYISPEQARDSKSADVRSDIYSLGCAWFHMLTGQTPFPSGSLTQKLKDHAATPAPDPREINASIPEDVVVVLQRMLEKSPDRRYQDPDALVDGLAAIDLDRTELTDNILAALAEDDSEPEPEPAPTARRSTRPPSSHPPQRQDDAPRRRADTPPPSAATDFGTKDTVDSVPVAPPRTQDNDNPAPTSQPPRRRKPPVSPPRRSETDSSRTAKPTPVPESEPPEPPAPTDSDDSKRSKSRRRSPADSAEHKSSRSDSEDSGASVSSRRSSSPPPSPRSRRGARQNDLLNDGADRPGVDWEKLKPVGLMVLGVTALGLLGYIFVNLSQSVDMSGNQDAGNLFGTKDGRATNRGNGSGDSSQGDIAYDTLPASTLLGKPAQAQAAPPQLRQGEQRHLFAWARSPQPATLPVLNVAARPLGPGHFHSLDAALAALTEQGGWIRLGGPGPFFITATELLGRGHVVISAPKSARAVVVFRPDQDDSNRTTVLSLRNTALELHDLDLAPAASAFAGDRRLTLISSQSSDLSLIGCTITQPQEREGGTAAVAVSGAPADHPARVLFERVLARGRNTTLLELDSRSADVALVNSLLVTDSAPPISVLTPGGGRSADDRRHIRLLSCTLCSDAPLLQLDSGGSGSGLPTTWLTLVNSLMACPSSGDRVLLDIGRWPQAAGAAGQKSHFQGLEWEQFGTVAYGVREFVRRDAETGLGISSFTEWQACWKNPGEATAFIPTPWLPLKSEADVVNPAYFDTGRLAGRLPPATDGTPPGCRVLALQTANTRVLARAPGQFGRPTWIPTSPRPRPLLSLKLADHPDLGRFLAEHPPPPHAVIVVEGSGRRTTSPITVETGSLRLVFQDAEHGPPLVLVPKPPGPNPQTAAPSQVSEAEGEPQPDPQEPRAASGEPPAAPVALFNVIGGSLELVGGRFQLSPSQGPAWLLSVADGSFTVRNCSLLGPRTTTQHDRGLITWSGSREDQSGRILGSYLAGNGTLLKARFQGRRLLIYDSLLLSTGSVLDLDLGQELTSSRSAVDIRHCSLSAARSVFLVRGNPPAGQAPPASRGDTGLDLFVDQTVLAQGLSANPQEPPRPVLLSCASGLLTDRVVRWWGVQNGFSPSLAIYLADRNLQGPTGKTGTASDFAELFAEPRRIRPLHGPGGVKLAGTLPDMARVRPQHFRLDHSSRGHSWGPGRRSIGANLDHLETQLRNVGPAADGTPSGKPDF